MEVEKKLTMSLEDLIKKSKPAAKKNFIKKAFTGEKQNPQGKRKGAVVKKQEQRTKKPTAGKLGIQKPLAKRERKSDDEPMTGGSRKKIVVRRTSLVASSRTSARPTYSRKVVISKGPNAPGEPRKVKVLNVPYDLTWKDVKAAMSEVGKIERCDVENGEALITFASHKEAEKAIQTYNGGDMNGRKIRVMFV